MAQAFSNFRGLKSNTLQPVWTEYDSQFPYACSQCRREFEKGGLRYLGSSLVRRSHTAVAVMCPDCKNGRDPHRKPVPVMAERRTSLD